MTGFDTDSPADDITTTINKFLEVGNRKVNVVEVSTFSDPLSVGVITFKSEAAKIGF